MQVADEVKLFETAKERRRLEALADFYAVFKTTEHLERAYIRDAITSEEYTVACQKLISQFKTTEKVLPAGLTTYDFITQYKLDVECPLAKERLLIAGVPATIMHSTGGVTTKQKAVSVLVAEATQEFITAMDVLRLNQRAVDEVQPVLAGLLNSLNKVEGAISTFDKSKIQHWLVLLNSMRAANDLDDEQVRQLLLDLDTCYAEFKASLAD